MSRLRLLDEKECEYFSHPAVYAGEVMRLEVLIDVRLFTVETEDQPVVAHGDAGVEHGNDCILSIVHSLTRIRLRTTYECKDV